MSLTSGGKWICKESRTKSSFTLEKSSVVHAYAVAGPEDDGQSENDVQNNKWFLNRNSILYVL